MSRVHIEQTGMANVARGAGKGAVGGQGPKGSSGNTWQDGAQGKGGICQCSPLRQPPAMLACACLLVHGAAGPQARPLYRRR
eukprot:11537843-Alexandrium_andersonii.AAC.1